MLTLDAEEWKRLRDDIFKKDSGAIAFIFGTFYSACCIFVGKPTLYRANVEVENGQSWDEHRLLLHGFSGSVFVSRSPGVWVMSIAFLTWWQDLLEELLVHGQKSLRQ